jgi:hypothetical protein
MHAATARRFPTPCPLVAFVRRAAALRPKVQLRWGQQARLVDRASADKCDGPVAFEAPKPNAPVAPDTRGLGARDDYVARVRILERRPRCLLLGNPTYSELRVPE